MAIKINGQDLLKRFINGQEIVRVYKNGGQIRPETVPPVGGDYLCFTAQESNSSVTLNKDGNPTVVSLEISYDKDTWMDYNIGGTIALSNVGDKVYMRNKSETPTGFSIGGSANFYWFSMTGRIGASGDITYLLCKNNTNTVQTNCFVWLFRWCSSLITAPNLPATTLAYGCYSKMFYLCTSLTTAPNLPATTLADFCYSGMFNLCTSLTTAPDLPATELPSSCYYEMFLDCTSLVVPPKISATIARAGSCYRMFYGCTSLATLPRLYATVLYGGCYSGMFFNCSSIKLSTTQTGEYQTPYRIPTSGTGREYSTPSLENMFSNTGGTFKGTPSINTTYYTSNQVI